MMIIRWLNGLDVLATGVERFGKEASFKNQVGIPSEILAFLRASPKIDAYIFGHNFFNFNVDVSHNLFNYV